MGVYMSDNTDTYLMRIAVSLESISRSFETMAKILPNIDENLSYLEGIRKEMDTLTSQVYRIANK
jgi:hypothetical protein